VTWKQLNRRPDGELQSGSLQLNILLSTETQGGRSPTGRGCVNGAYFRRGRRFTVMTRSESGSLKVIPEIIRTFLLVQRRLRARSTAGWHLMCCSVWGGHIGGLKGAWKSIFPCRRPRFASIDVTHDVRRIEIMVKEVVREDHERRDGRTTWATRIRYW